VIYNNDDFKADYAYAGDLQGNLWKFDLSAADPALWHIAYGAHTANQNSPLYAPLPLFSAQREGKAQAVTSAPLIAPHPAGEGFLVYFGTGKYLQDIDQQDTSIQSVYAIWDKNRCSDNGEIKSCAEIAAPLNHIHTRVTRAKLLEQKITAQSSGQRTSSEYPVRWHEHSGWFMDLDYSPGERVVVQALVRGQLVFFSTSLPAANQCSDETGGWLMAFNRVDGSTPEQQAFDVNNDGSYDEHDSLDNQLTSGVKMSEPSVGMTTLGCGDKLCLVGESLTPVNEGISWGRWRWQMLSD
jgi:type IV pilus assembly protein PilY1